MNVKYLAILAVIASLGLAGCGETAYQEATNKAKTTPLSQLNRKRKKNIRSSKRPNANYIQSKERAKGTSANGSLVPRPCGLAP
jgi:outer membrane biogenesis lipoprotein LolB